MAYRKDSGEHLQSGSGLDAWGANGEGEGLHKPRASRRAFERCISQFQLVEGSTSSWEDIKVVTFSKEGCLEE